MENFVIDGYMAALLELALDRDTALQEEMARLAQVVQLAVQEAADQCGMDLPESYRLVKQANGSVVIREG